MQEPRLVQGRNPERALQRALVAKIRSMLAKAEVRFILLEAFGLDIAIFVESDGRKYARFIEVKAFVGSRPGGVGIGNSAGQGSQVDLLLHSPLELKTVDASIRWLLCIGTISEGKPRYALFTSAEAREAMMGGVARGKQNNLRVTDFQDRLVDWDELLNMLRQFLLG